MKRKALLIAALGFGGLWLGLELLLKFKTPEGQTAVTGLRVGQHLFGLLFDALLLAFALRNLKALPAWGKALAGPGALPLVTGIFYHAAAIGIFLVRPIVTIRQASPALAQALVGYVRAYNGLVFILPPAALALILVPIFIHRKKD